MKGLLITGGSGLLGANVAVAAKSRFNVYATYNKHRINIDGVECLLLDIREHRAVCETVDEIKPQYIIHCAAMSDVDQCERDIEEAYRLNVIASRNVAESAKRIGAHFIYISTDSVFDGLKDRYSEEDTPNPINVYADTKHKAELAVLEWVPSACVVRTNIYGWNTQNKLSLAEWFWKNLHEKQRIRGFDDVYFTPVLVNNLADVLLELLHKRFSGIYHVAGNDRISKYEFGAKIASIFGLSGDYLEPISVATHCFAARRPQDTSLNSSRIKSLLSTKLYGVDEGLQLFKKLLDTGYVEKLKGYCHG
ncbi:SDR family oxidoreductase [Planctomycetota bacterium]